MPNIAEPAPNQPARRGRPPRDPVTVRNAVLRVRVTADERAALEQAAGDQDVSTWLRDLGLAAASGR